MQFYIGLQTALYMCICVHTGVNVDHIEKFWHIIFNFSIQLDFTSSQAIVLAVFLWLGQAN